MNFKLCTILVLLIDVSVWTFSHGQADFGACYTKHNTGKAWESFSRTGQNPDIIVQISEAYEFSYIKSPLSFQISASVNKPIQNLCFEIRNWEKSKAAGLKINGNEYKSGQDFRQDLIMDKDGTYTIIIWLEIKSISIQSFEIERI